MAKGSPKMTMARLRSLVNENEVATIAAAMGIGRAAPKDATADVKTRSRTAGTKATTPGPGGLRGRSRDAGRKVDTTAGMRTRSRTMPKAVTRQRARRDRGGPGGR
jgi:hypothetical protein